MTPGGLDVISETIMVQKTFNTSRVNITQLNSSPPFGSTMLTSFMKAHVVVRRDQRQHNEPRQETEADAAVPRTRTDDSSENVGGVSADAETTSDP